MKRLLVVLLLLPAAAPRAAAQLPGLFPPGSYILDVWYPKIFWTSREGFTAGGYFAIIAPLTYEHYDDAPPFAAGITLNGQASASGSRFLELDAFAPALVDGWRFRLTAATRRANRQNWFGLGNGTTVNEANEAGGQELFYRSRFVRHSLRGEIQRRIVGGLRLLGGFHAERWTLDTLTGTSQLAQDAGTALPAGLLGNAAGDLTARLGLVYDTRDSESAPRRGIFLEGLHAFGEAGGAFYARTTVSARGYLPLTPGIIMSARVAGRRMGGDPPVGSLALFDASDEPFTALGGSRSHRALRDGRFLGEHVLLGNLDVQYTAFEVPTLVRVLLVGFVDAGRVFQGEAFRLTTDDLHVGGGGGFLLHMFRNAVLGVTVGGGPDGAVVHAHASWPY